MRRQKKQPKKIKKIYRIEEFSYKNKSLYDFHLECKEARNDGAITSFEIPTTTSTKSRYTTYKPIINNIQFDSLMEAKYYVKLCYDLKDGKIKNFERQRHFELLPKFKKNGKSYRGIEYVCDFYVINKDDSYSVIDVKGKETVEFKIKHKMFEYKYPEYSLSVIQFYEPQSEWLTLDEIKKINKNKKKTK